LVPGLLQSEGYARAAFETRIPPLSDEQMETQAAARMGRQNLIRERPNTSFSSVVEEYIVQRPLGGSQVLRDRLDHMLELCPAPQRVRADRAYSRCVPCGVDGSLALLEIPEGKCLVYSEGQESGRLIADPKQAAVLHKRYATFRAQALTLRDSVGLLGRIRGDL
jgi:hypothetical protein